MKYLERIDYCCYFHSSVALKGWAALDYRQTLYQVVQRAIALNSDTLILGFSADIEKRKLGAVTTAKVAFMQFKDNYKQTVINNMGMEHLKKHY